MTRQPVERYTIALLFGALAAACSNPAPSSDAVPEAGAPAAARAQPKLPPNHPPLDQAAPTATGRDTRGIVVETMDSGGYTYARVESRDEGEIWVAGPVTKLAVGDSVRVSLALPMRGFPSKTLERTFDLIYFVQSYH